jgi:DNA repair photolyase
MIKEIEAKTIISKVKNPSMWFGIEYNTNFYRGCSHKCIYCDSRSECYNIENFNDIEVKTNAPLLLERELMKKKRKYIIGTGAMCDPYMHAEKKYEITKKCLEVINKYHFPVTITTKSDLILRDIELLKEINKKSKVMVMITITTVDDDLSKIIEPNTPLSSTQFQTIKKLTEVGIETGILLMPVLPYITDTEENIKNLVLKAKEVNTSFIISFFGVTLRDRQRDYYYKMLDKHFPLLKTIYMKEFGNSYSCTSKRYRTLKNTLIKTCNENNINYKMNKINYYSPKEDNQLSLF